MATDLNFRNGFLLHAQGEQGIALPPGWRHHVLEDLVLWAHPDTNLHVSVNSAVPVAFIGEAFDPEGGVFSTMDIVEAIQDRVGNRDDFLDYLDRLAGRFSLAVRHDGSWNIYHDAIGSRSVFYHRDRRIAASHVELIAEPLRLRMADYFIPFITSRNYHLRDVKYLPGALTPYDEILQLTPNTFLSLGGMKTSRYWPRKPVVHHADMDAATRELERHMTGLSRYFTANGLRPLLGLTGGTDSRGLFAALKNHSPRVFSWVRSKEGDQLASQDSRAAEKIAKVYGLDVDIWPLRSARLNDADDDIGQAFRRSTSYYRGITALWLSPLGELGGDYGKSVFVRGFGGEILRGFYQEGASAIQQATPEKLSRAYDVNAGSDITRKAFAGFMAASEFSEARLLGRDPSDMFYWEHRMGTWGSVTMSEADIAVRSLVGYNSRNLFDSFLGLDFPQRKTRGSFHEVVRRLAPEIAAIKVV